MRLASPHRLSTARRILVAAAIVLVAGECTLNVDLHDSNAILKGNDNQTGAANTQLSSPLMVLVVDQFGQPLGDITVTWAILSGGGSLSATSTQTDQGGVASVNYTTGPTAGTATIQARVSGAPPVVFTVTIT